MKLINTGYSTLDEALQGGVYSSSIVCISSAPGMGKTGLLKSLYESLKYEHKDLSLVFMSLEESEDSLKKRISQDHFQVDFRSDEIIQDFLNCPGINHANSIIFIDGIHLIETDEKSYLSFLRCLKTHAIENNSLFFITCPLSRKPDSRPGHRPMLSDMSSFGEIEQCVDYVWFLLRREYYDPNDKPGIAEIIIAKNRHGSVCNATLTYDNKENRFHNYEAIVRASYSDDADFGHFSP